MEEQMQFRVGKQMSSHDSSASSMAESQKLQEISDAQLLEDLTQLAAEWIHLATQLGITAAEQHAIEGERNRAQKCLQGVIEEWLIRSEGPHTKAKVVETLRTTAMGPLNRLAKKISENTDIPDVFDKSSLGILTSSLNDTAANYNTFGVMLGVRHNKIKAIENRVVDVKIYLCQMLEKWRESKNPQLTDILKAIRCPTICNMRLARELEKKWIGQGFLPKPEPKADESEQNEDTIDGEID